MPIQNLSRIEEQIKREHAACVQHATDCITHALRCGALLATYRATCAGDWCERLERIGIARSTAHRYIRVAEDAAKKQSRVKYLLEQGASLVDLYRAFDLVKPVEPGGYKSDVYQRRRLGEQLELDFSYEEFTPQIKSLVRARNVEELSPSTLQRLRADLEAARQRIDTILAEKTALNLNPEP